MTGVCLYVHIHPKWQKLYLTDRNGWQRQFLDRKLTWTLYVCSKMVQSEPRTFSKEKQQILVKRNTLGRLVRTIPTNSHNHQISKKNTSDVVVVMVVVVIVVVVAVVYIVDDTR